VENSPGAVLKQPEVKTKHIERGRFLDRIIEELSAEYSEDDDIDLIKVRTYLMKRGDFEKKEDDAFYNKDYDTLVKIEATKRGIFCTDETKKYKEIAMLVGEERDGDSTIFFNIPLMNKSDYFRQQLAA